MAGEKAWNRIGVGPAAARLGKLGPKEFEQLGFNAICFGLETIMHAAKAMQTVLADMRSGTFALRDKGMSFEEFKSVVHYDRWDRIDNLYAPRDGAPPSL